MDRLHSATTGARRRRRPLRAIAALLSLVLAASFMAASPASAASAATASLSTNIVGSGVTVVVTIDGTGGFDGAEVLAVSACGNASTAGAPLPVSEDGNADNCFNADDDLAIIADGGTASGLAVVVGPVDGATHTVNYEWTEPIGVNATTCVANGNYACTISVNVALIDQTILQQIVTPVYTDTDTDTDGIVDDLDNCAADANPTQADADRDGEGNECDTDDDNDGVEDGDDNCQFVANDDQADGDGDGVGDACAGGLAAACPSPGATTPFTDVSATSFSGNDIACLFELGVAKGSSVTAFGPNEVLTREQMTVFLSRLYEVIKGEAAPIVATPFTDTADSFAAGDIARMYGLGVTMGTSGTEFSPLDEVTREQLAVFISRMYTALNGEAAPVVSTPLADAGSSFAAADIARLYGLGVTMGTSATEFSPAATVTREQMAVFVSRLYRVTA